MDAEERLRRFVERAKKARPRFATALGWFSIRFAEMEARIDSTIHAMLGLGTFEGRALTGSINSFALRLEILRTLVLNLETTVEISTAIDDAIDKAEVLNGDRNAYLHEPWGAMGQDSPMGEIHYQKVRLRRDGRKGVFEWKHRNVTVKEVQTRTRQCRALAKSLAALQPAIRDARAKAKAKGDVG